MNCLWLSILFISGVICNIFGLSIDCGEFYDDDTISKTWGYVYYSCNGTVMTDADNNRAMELFGLHLHGRNSSYTERFILNNQNLTSFPTNFDKFFPFLRIIDFSFNYIDSLTNNQLQPYKRLNSLILEHNKISTLDSNLFDGLNQLIDVRLNDNDIKHVGFDIKLPQHVYMDNNPCTPTCCIFIPYQTTISVSEFLRNHCPPLQSTIGQSVRSTPNHRTSIIVDHTQEKDETPVTEEPGIDAKLPKMGEVIHCSLAVLLRENDEPLGKRCSEMYNSHHYALRLFDNPDLKRKMKEEWEMDKKAAEAAK